jgi:uncharacterized membrane protein YqhA
LIRIDTNVLNPFPRSSHDLEFQEKYPQRIFEEITMTTSRRVSTTLFKSRYMVMLAVGTLYLLAAILFGYATIKTVFALPNLLSSLSEEATKSLMLFAVETADLFLIAVVLYVTAAGLYALFMGKRPTQVDGEKATWLEVETLDDLKQNLIGVVVVAMSVLFLGVVIRGDSERNVLEVGGGIAAVVAALGWYVSQKSKAKESDAKTVEVKNSSS